VSRGFGVALEGCRGHPLNLLGLFLPTLVGTKAAQPIKVSK
jgi:hypothetical protein